MAARSPGERRQSNMGQTETKTGRAAAARTGGLSKGLIKGATGNPGSFAQSSNVASTFSDLMREFAKPVIELELLTEMGAGQSFGEWALVKDEKRAATVKMHTEADLVMIDKNTYDECLKEKRVGLFKKDAAIIILREKSHLDRTKDDIRILML